MRAFTKTPMDTVESTLDRYVYVLLMDLAVSTSVFGVAHTCAVVTPTRVTAVVGACFNATILATKARFTPASTIEAKTIVGAVVEADGDRAVNTLEVGMAGAGTVVAKPIATAVLRADLH